MSRKQNLYALVNKVNGGSIESVALAANDGILIRDNLPILKRAMPYVLDDMEFQCIGYFDDEVLTVHDVPKPVKWDSYKFPENEVKPLSPEEQAQLRKQ